MPSDISLWSSGMATMALPSCAEAIMPPNRRKSARGMRLAGCDEMQGFLFAKPRKAQDIATMLENARAEAAPVPSSRTA